MNIAICWIIRHRWKDWVVAASGHIDGLAPDAVAELSLGPIPPRRYRQCERCHNREWIDQKN